MLCYVMLCYDMLCYVMLCYVMLFHVMFHVCYAMLIDVTLGLMTISMLSMGRLTDAVSTDVWKVSRSFIDQSLR